ATGPRGLQGPQGDKGATGSPGEATAYARVAADGTLEPRDSGRQNKTVIAVDVEHTIGTGVYCFGGLPFAVASAVVSSDGAADPAPNTIASVAVQRGITLTGCDSNHQQARVRMVTVANAPIDHRFFVWFEATGFAQIAPGPGVGRRWGGRRIRALLDHHDEGVLFISGCVANRGKFSPRFDAIVLLSAPADVILERVASRETNPFGAREEERDRILHDLATV